MVQCRCDSYTGCVYQLQLYQGRKTTTEFNLRERVVLGLCKDFRGYARFFCMHRNISSWSLLKRWLVHLSAEIILSANSQLSKRSQMSFLVPDPTSHMSIFLDYHRRCAMSLKKRLKSRTFATFSTCDVSL